MKLITWNMAHRHESWRFLLDLDIDLTLLQEAGKPPPDVAERIRASPTIEVDAAPWKTLIADRRLACRTAIVNLSRLDLR